MASLIVINLFFAGLLAGAEIAAHYGFVIHAPFLAASDQVRLRQALTRRLRILMPALFLPTFASTLVVFASSQHGLALALRGVAVAGTLLWAYARIFRTIGINRASVGWNPDAPPTDWRARVERAERFHIVSLWAVTLGFLCLTIASQLQAG